MALRLFEHNEKAYRAAIRMMEQYGKAAIVHPTGTGKSYIAFKLIEDNPEKVVIWLSPSEYIFKTQLEGLKGNVPDFPLENVHFYTYAKLMCCAQAQLDEIAAQKPAYIVLDEFHRAGAECWGESTVALLKLCPDAKLLGLTATNIRYLDNNRDMAEELFDNRVASNMTLGEAVVRGILPAPKYVTTVYQYQKALAKYQARVDNLRTQGIQDVNQKYLDALRRALEQADGLDRVFAHHITNKSGKYIVFCANKEHMDEMVSHVPEWFAGVNPDVVVYEAYSDDPNTDKAFVDFKTDTSNRLKLLFCIDMLNEGVHVEGISGVILFRPTISPIIYKQQIGRALTAGDNTTPLILDVVNNFEGLTSISGLQSEMQEAVHRLYANGESDKIVTERFEVIEQVHDCRVLFERLQESLSSSWEHYFSEASIYYAEHGDLKVPKQYKTPAGLSLGVWLVTQRGVREGRVSGNLTEQQIARLDSIGMAWGNQKESAWQRGFEKAKKYHDTYGNLMVAGKYVDPDGYPLGKWLIKTRQQKLNGNLKEERIAQLDEIGMVWSVFDAKEAGAAIIEACKALKAAGTEGRIGSYGAFELHSRFDNFDKVFRLSIKGAWNYSMEVGKDPQGNILRVTNALAGIERTLPQVERRLETLEQQLAQAKEEAKRPFAQEAELTEKSARLAELNSLLNMDEKGSEDALGVDEDAAETEVADRPRQPANYAGRVAERTADNVRKPSVLAQLHAKQAERTAEPQKFQKRKSHDIEL